MAILEARGHARLYLWMILRIVWDTLSGAFWKYIGGTLALGSSPWGESLATGIEPVPIVRT
jgi:hypothetical protein